MVLVLGLEVLAYILNYLVEFIPLHVDLKTFRTAPRSVEGALHSGR